MSQHIAKLERIVGRMSDLEIEPNEFVLMSKSLEILSADFEPLKMAWCTRPEQQQTLSELQKLLVAKEQRRSVDTANVALVAKAGFTRNPDNDIIILHCEDVEGFDTSIPLTNYLFNLCVMYNIFENERTMFINLKDVISSIELCLKRKKKGNKMPETEISDEEIIDFYNDYVSCFSSEKANYDDKSVMLLKDVLKESNCIDVWQLLDKCLHFKTESDILNHIASNRYLLLGTPNSLVLKKLSGVLSGNEVCSISVETPLDASLHGSPSFHVLEKIKITCESLKLEEIPLNIEKESKFGSATEEYIEDTILAFLSLLINSRNELALSKAMISPIIDLSHEAFTALKHLSVEKDMPMCQVAISYVTRLRLGGKGYAPSGDCPMLPHLKALELFVDTLNQMQTIIEEDSQPRSAIKRLINILKKKLLKCGNDKLKDSSVEIVTEKLQATLLIVSDMMKSRISSNTSQICQEALDFLYQFVNFVNSNNFIYDPDIIIAKNHAKRTPLNLPPLLGYFRSPEDEPSCDAESSQNEDSALSRSSLVQRPAFPSYFHHSESSDVSSSCINSSTPSRTTFIGCLKERNENDRNENMIKLSGASLKNSTNVMTSKKNPKRSILGEITNENDSLANDYTNGKNRAKKLCNISEKNAKENACGANNRKSKKEPKKVAKKFKQIAGQGKITNFFITNKNT